MKQFLTLFLVFFTLSTITNAQNYGQELLQELNATRNMVEDNPKDKALNLKAGSLSFQFSNYLNDANQIEKAQKYIYDAEYYHLKALEIDSMYFDALSSYGSFNYNLSMVDYDNRLNLPVKYKTKYKELTETTNFRLQKAHSMFVRAESINPNDIDIIISFQEIYAVTMKSDLNQEYVNRRKQKEESSETTFTAYDKHPSSSELEL